jgi:hypothetical protein
MLKNLFRRQKKQIPSSSKEPSPEALSWDSQATAALNQAVSQVPVPGPFKNRVKRELQTAAEDHARTANRTNVTPEDLMQGFLAKMPAGMRQKVENAMKEGPDGLKRLQKDLGQQ